MMQKNTFLRKHRNSSCYHFRVRIPVDLQKHFKDKKEFTISLRTGVYRDASRTATRLYTLSQIIFDKIRMQEIDLDHEGVKKVLLVEITRNIKNAQLTKWESTTDVKRMKVDISLEREILFQFSFSYLICQTVQFFIICLITIMRRDVSFI